MNRRTLKIVAALLLAGTGLYTGCQRQRAGAPLPDSIPNLTPKEQTGQIVFMRYCHECHPGGGAGVGPSLNTKPLLSSAIKFQVRNGLGAMPPFGDETISDANLDAVTDYLARIRGKTRPW